VSGPQTTVTGRCGSCGARVTLSVGDTWDICPVCHQRASLAVEESPKSEQRITSADALVSSADTVTLRIYERAVSEEKV
jgi:hypothetical protein